MAFAEGGYFENLSKCISGHNYASVTAPSVITSPFLTEEYFLGFDFFVMSVVLFVDSSPPGLFFG
ncbi:MAG: hypothetical protein KAR31_02140 [Candidatus Omnitrophica bacterium]|nr:hypothetical protein [Candidatus Omnitrophota bacterium]